MSDWGEFYNNLATDIAPIITLFGEQPVKQFLSESTSGWDALTLAILPLGVLTIVVSAIRVSDVGILKAFIGRAQEPEAAVKVELCSSTSHSICELWGGSGVTRIFGRPNILEFVCKKENGGDAEEDHGDSEGDISKETPTKPTSMPTFRIYPTERFLNEQCLEGDWREKTSNFKNGEYGEIPGRFAPKPNLALNIGLRDKSPVLSMVVAIVAILLGVSWLGFSAWLTFILQPEPDSNVVVSQQPLFFCLLVFSSLWSWAGLGVCSYLVNKTTHERRFSRTKKDTKEQLPSDFICWLQPGSQEVGNQVFNAFAYSQSFSTYITSFRSYNPPRKKMIWISATSAIVGWALQFLCLRSLHAFVSVYLLCATLFMAVLRAALRARRLDPEKNDFCLADDATTVEGHELDWQALKIEQLANIPYDGSSKPISTRISGEAGDVLSADWHNTSRFSICDEYHRHGPLCHSERSDMLHGSFVHSASSSQGNHLIVVKESDSLNAQEIVDMVMSSGGPEGAAHRVLSYRIELADMVVRSLYLLVSAFARPTLLRRVGG